MTTGVDDHMAGGTAEKSTLANQLKIGVYRLIRVGPVTRDFDLRDQIRKSARAAPRLISEGFGRYLPTEFIRYLRWANGEVQETSTCLRDGLDAGYFSEEQVELLVRLAKRSSKAIGGLIRYLERCPDPRTGRRDGRPRTRPRGRASQSERCEPEREHREAEPEPMEPDEPDEANEPD